MEPICTSGTQLDETSSLCYSSCSKFSTAFTKYTVYNQDPSSCLPSCPVGYTFIGVEAEKAQCAKCEGATLKQTPSGWRCAQEGLPLAKPTIRARSLRDRHYKASSCPEGAYSDSNGVCHACGNVATPSSIAAGAPESGPFTEGIDTPDVELYSIVFDAAISGRKAPVCIPEFCCISDSGEFTGEEGEGLHGDEDLAPEDDADGFTIGAVNDDGIIGGGSMNTETAEEDTPTEEPLVGSEGESSEEGTDHDFSTVDVFKPPPAPGAGFGR